jgi:ligand-binding SRPBCC domain-containing protein
MPDSFVFRHAFHVDAPVEAVADFHFSPGAFLALRPPGTPMRLLHADPLAEGSVLRFRAGVGPVGFTWTARHHGVDRASGFTDVQADGPLGAWAHTHRWRPDPVGGTVVEDEIHATFRPGLRAAWARLAFGPLALRGLFWFRARATRAAVRARAGSGQTG